jgi:hypothetical protein
MRDGPNTARTIRFAPRGEQTFLALVASMRPAPPARPAPHAAVAP